MNAGVDRARRLRRRGDLLEHDGKRGLREERRPTREELVEDDPHRIEIRPRVELLAARLLGRHVLGGTDEDAARGELCAGRLRRRVRRALVLLGDLRDPEVADLDDVVPLVVFAIEDHDVLGLEIAMDHAHVVRSRDRRESLHDDVGDPLFGERPVLEDHLVELAPLEILHRHVEEAVRLLSELDHAHRARMIEATRSPCLAVEPADEARVDRHRRVHHLERDLPVETVVAGTVDRPHRAATEELLDDELPGDAPADERGVSLFRHSSNHTRTLPLAEGPPPQGTCPSSRIRSAASLSVTDGRDRQAACLSSARVDRSNGCVPSRSGPCECMRRA